MCTNTWALLLIGLTCCDGAENSTSEALEPKPDAAAAIEDAVTATDAQADSDIAADSSAPDSSEMQRPINGDPRTGAHGSDQCPQYEVERCPEGCQGIYGVELDEANDCTLPRTLLDCSTEAVFADESVCRVSKRTGRTYRVSVIALTSPSYDGWEACSEEVAEAVLNVDSCE